MKIVIDTTPLASGHKTRGIGRYTRQLAESLQRFGEGHQIVQTSRVESVQLMDIVHYPYFDLFHTHLPLIPPAAKEVVTIHDLIPLRFPRTYKPGIKSGLNLWLQRRLVRRVAAVITDSQASRNDILELLHLPKTKVHVVSLGVDREFQPQTTRKITQAKLTYSLPDKYALYVGDVNVNKNIRELIAAVARVPDLSLVVVSSALKNTSLPEVQVLEEEVRQRNLTDRFYRVTSVPVDPSSDLAAIYSGAFVYVQPSLYEGYGLPLLEAMACGTPVVSSNTSSLPEVAGDAALLVQPTATALVAGIEQLMKRKGLRAELIEKGLKRAKDMTWEKTARQTLRIYEGVIHPQ